MEEFLGIYVWEFAQEHGFTLVLKDSDFWDVSLLISITLHFISSQTNLFV